MGTIAGGPTGRRELAVTPQRRGIQLVSPPRQCTPAKGCALIAREQLPPADSDRPSIRRYLPSDRESVKCLAVACADQRIFPTCWTSHQRLVSDVLTRYYLDFEPAACWVVSDPEEGVIGYLLGCSSTARRNRVVAGRVLPAVTLRAVLTGAVFSCPVGQLAWAGLRSWTSGHAVKSRATLGYPAHLHVGVHPDYRQQGFGRELVLRFVDQAHDEGIPGIHVSVVEANLSARMLFRNVGFDVLGRYEVLFPGSRSPVRMLLLGMLTSPHGGPQRAGRASRAKGRR
jgi:ribosomal protein S18 acetylase RimI-like enzyme